MYLGAGAVAGRGDTARKLEARLDGSGDARLSVEDLSRLSVDDLFMEEYGLCCTRRLPLGLAKPPAFSI